MTKSINKQYKFVYMRDDRYDRSFDNNDFSDIRAKCPKFVFANKQPDIYMYNNGVRACDFMSLYLSDYSFENQKSFTEAEWIKHTVQFLKQEVSRFKKQKRSCEKSTELDLATNYYYRNSTMLLKVYEQELKMYKAREQMLRDRGDYTYLALTK